MRTAALAGLVLVTYGCHKPRTWTISPTVPTALTMEEAPGGRTVRVDMFLPQGYVRPPSDFTVIVEWRDQHSPGYGDDSPTIELNLLGRHHPFQDGCSEDGTTPVDHHVVHDNLELFECGPTPRSQATGEIYGYWKVPATDPDDALMLGCAITFFVNLPTPADIDDAVHICSSVHVREYKPVGAPVPEGSGS